MQNITVGRRVLVHSPVGWAKAFSEVVKHVQQITVRDAVAVKKQAAGAHHVLHEVVCLFLVCTFHIPVLGELDNKLGEAFACEIAVMLKDTGGAVKPLLMLVLCKQTFNVCTISNPEQMFWRGCRKCCWGLSWSLSWR